MSKLAEANAMNGDSNNSPDLDEFADALDELPEDDSSAGQPVVGGKQEFLLEQLTLPKLKQYRTKLEHPRPRSTFGLWSFLKNWIGRDLTKITMPVTFNEPLSFTQRLVEDIEYVDLLHKAAECSNSVDTLSYLAVFSATQWVTTFSRHSKPFNPLLGETFEYVRPDLGYYCISEQVSHHPPVTAVHIEAEKWTFWEEYKLDLKFRGQWVRVMPTGLMHFKVKSTQHHYSWTKPHTVVHNLIFGSLWADHEGDIVIKNHQTDEHALVVFTPYSRAGDKYRRIAGQVFDSQSKVVYTISGSWDEKLERMRIGEPRGELIWTANPAIPNAEQQYGFTLLSMTLNELDDEIKCPTDSRFRPDQRHLEQNEVEEAVAEKHRLEEKQRVARRVRLQNNEEWSPRWFDLISDPDTGTDYYAYNGKYWTAKLSGDYSSCPDIY